MTVKYSIMFYQETISRRVAGWTENWYADGTIANNSMTGTNFFKARTLFMPNNAGISGMRVSDIGGQSKVFTFNEPGGQQTAVDIPQMALNCSVKVQGSPTTKWFQLRGIPDSSVTSGAFRPTQGVSNAIDTFLNGLFGYGVYVRVKRLTNPRVNITSIDASGNFTIAPGVTPAMNDTVQLLRCKDIHGKNVSGLYVVIPDANGLPKKLGNWSGKTVAVSGQLRILTYDYLPTVPRTAEYHDITTRKVGRPFFSYRGKRTRR